MPLDQVAIIYYDLAANHPRAEKTGISSQRDGRLQTLSVQIPDVVAYVQRYLTISLGPRRNTSRGIRSLCYAPICQWRSSCTVTSKRRIPTVEDDSNLTLVNTARFLCTTCAVTYYYDTLFLLPRAQVRRRTAEVCVLRRGRTTAESQNSPFS